MVAAVGIGVPGQVDNETGEVKLAVNLETPTLPLGHILSTYYGVPVFVENDGNAVTLGTYRFLAEKSIRHMAFVTLGTGVGAGLVINGELYRGSRGMAGEIGHIVVEDSDFRCQCGKYGCLETFVAGPAIARFGREAATQQETVLNRLETITAKDVFDAAAHGDTAALAIVDRVGRYLGRATQALMMSYDVELIYIGGGLSRAGDILLRPIQAEWVRQAALSDMAGMMLDIEQLKLVPPSFRAGAWGAVSVALDGLSKNYQMAL
jgi:glucokinase